MSVMEISGAIGASCGPFIGSALNYLFGYEGPFICFGITFLLMIRLYLTYINIAILYIEVLTFLIVYIPSDVKLEEKIHVERI
jgi:MFS family permease